ncbi:MAG TPA: acetate--CoA ligase family protein [Candidatus Kapabacteria bacterium]|nr:acetate--CoA ligase family protein [Candidatus Kapabacteria bacterium]HPU22557.1 acetate--CoA ligase family protein [Candidatus Kapabacteria bacterium]
MVREIFAPKSIAIIGASNDISKPGGRILKNIIDGKFTGSLYAVNPKEEQVQNLKCYKSAEELPEVELAILAIAAKFCPDTVRILAEKKKTKGFIILSAGFSEVGDEGKKLEQEIVEIINQHGGTLIGPNCIGVLTPTYQGVFAGPLPKLEPQGVDFVSGSGATACFILELAIPRGLTFASVYSVGNSAQTGVEDVLRQWDNTFDPATSSKVKIMYLEKINNPELFLKHSRSLIEKGCRIAAIKAGTTEAGSRAVSSHTGALAGSDLPVDALFRKAGIIRCHSRSELVDVAIALQQKPLLGNRIAVITHAGGPGVMLTDTLDKNNMQVPHITGDKANELMSNLFPGSSVANPIDFLATGTAQQLGIILDYCDNHFDNIDASVVIFGTTGMFDSFPVYEVLHEKIRSCKKPIFPVLPSVVLAKEAADKFIEKGNCIFVDEVSAGNALAKIYHTPKPISAKYFSDIDKNTIRSIIDNSENGYLEPEKVTKILDAIGIAHPLEFSSSNLPDIIEFANRIGYPLVAKVVGPVHKSDVGGVIVGIQNENELTAAFEKLMRIDQAKAVLIQQMASGTEIFIGAKKEDKFGHLVLCGIGGIFIEVLKDFSYALTPISEQEAFSMIRSLRSYKLIQGVRGKEGVNEQIFADYIQRVSALLQVAPEISEMDINPLLGSQKALIAVDARIKIEK